MTAQPVYDLEPTAPVPPVEPDPEIIDNAEGNERIRRDDKAAAAAQVADLRKPRR